HVKVRHCSCHGVRARKTLVDGSDVIGVDEADEGMESGSAELLEVGWLTDLGKSVLRECSFQRRDLVPFLALAFASSTRIRYDVIAQWHEILDQCHASHRRSVRTSNDDARRSSGRYRSRAVWSSQQRVAQRHAVSVIRNLPGGIACAAPHVKQSD